MVNRVVAADANLWQSVFRMLLAPISWIPGMQRWFLDFFLSSSSDWASVWKCVLLLLPVLLFVAAMWCTLLSLYTFPFRSARVRFAGMVVLSWWDAARAAWFYWVGLFRVGVVALGWCLTLARLALRLVMEALRQLLIAPFTLTGRLSRRYFQPGVPWIAFIMLLFWCLLEATIFTYTLFPTVSEVLADMVGMEAPRFAGPVLYLFLLLLILGSFACIQALLDTFKRRQFNLIVQMVLVELFVMFFEVMFLYRELVDAITPWIAQQTGERFRLGIGFTLSVAAFGWVGIRGMTWFLFGQFGTPPLLAFISRQPMAQAEGPAPEPPGPEPVSCWQELIQDFKRETDWLHAKSQEILEYLALPFLHVLAAALNFAMILVASRPVISLPLKSLKDIMDTREIANSIRLQPNRAESQ
ncbi:MAG: hypothetical protein AUH92_04880 [Acidobacteria bacterium 13_1_40CM_4_69_4]|nr:MAG: hypothetical protein AUH92_04880 [Acidobacteria bacterium 13_1_40CM_4_69_4]